MHRAPPEESRTPLLQGLCLRFFSESPFASRLRAGSPSGPFAGCPRDELISHEFHPSRARGALMGCSNERSESRTRGGEEGGLRRPSPRRRFLHDGILSQRPSEGCLRMTPRWRGRGPGLQRSLPFAIRLSARCLCASAVTPLRRPLKEKAPRPGALLRDVDGVPAYWQVTCLPPGAMRKELPSQTMSHSKQVVLWL